jgi:outer membrane protein
MTRSRTGWAFLLLVFGLATEAVAATDILELYTRATEIDPTFQIARSRRAQSEVALKNAHAGVRPEVSGNLEQSKTYQNIKDSSSPLFSVGSSDFFTDTYSINVVQPIYQAETMLLLPRARAQSRQAAFDFAAEEQELIFRLVQAFLEFVAAQDSVTFTVAERTAIERQLQESESRLETGLGTIGAVHEARARLSLARAAEITAGDELEQRRQAIAEITGVVPTDVPSLSDTFALNGPDRPNVDLWVESSLFQNPRLKALEAGVDAAEQEMRRQRMTGKLPSLDAVASFSNRDTGGTEFGGGNETATGLISLRLGIPIYDGGRSRYAGRSAALDYRIAIQGVERGRRRVELETRKAFRGVMSGSTRVEALSQSVFSGEVVVAVTEEGLRAGLATRRDLLDATRDLFSSRRDLAAARYEYLLSGLSLKLWAGTLGVADLQELNTYFQ